MLDDAGIKYYNASVVAYESIFNKKHPERVDEVRKAIALFADPDNYPIVFHCAIGTDRTGTIALLLQGLLGVDNVEVYKNYYLSWFAACISEDVDSRVNSFFQTYNKLSRYVSKDRSLAENTEAFLLSIGVTQEEIDSIRSIMIEYPEE